MIYRTLISMSLTAAATLFAQPPAPEQSLSIQNGVVAFHVGTNIPAIEVSGKSAAMQARLLLRQDEAGLRVDRVEAWVPTASLRTGMAIRDSHMQRRIFTDAQGQTPDLRFESAQASCPGVTAGKEATCSISGSLSIRGVARPFTIPLKVRQESNTAFRASGDGTIKLSDYGIEQPTQLGVKTSNDVTIHLDFSGRVTPLVAAAPGGK